MKNCANNLNSEKQALKKGIKGWQIGLIALREIIGSGYFLGTGYAYSKIGPNYD